jgi:RHH-type rel operon transcriptional repressor/antitoxin RelB
MEVAMAVSLRLPDDLNIRLSNLADKTGRSKTFYMLEAIRDHLDDLEDLYLAEQRLIDVRAGRSRTVSLDDVERELGLAG